MIQFACDNDDDDDDADDDKNRPAISEHSWSHDANSYVDESATFWTNMKML